MPRYLPYVARTLSSKYITCALCQYCILELMLEIAPQMGIVCDDPEELRQRMTIYEIEAIDSRYAAERGFSLIYPWGALIPGKPRGATLEDAERIIATEHTTWPVQLILLPPDFREKAEAECPLDSSEPPPPLPYKPILPGLSGVLLCKNFSSCHRPTTTISYRHINYAGPAYVGLHVDAYEGEERNHRALIANLGPADRDHMAIFDPAWERRTMLRDLGSPTVQYKIFEQITARKKGRKKGQPVPDLIGIRLRGRRWDNKIEALAGLAVTEFVHDGKVRYDPAAATWSTSILASVDMDSLGTFESPLAVSASRRLCQRLLPSRETGVRPIPRPTTNNQRPFFPY